MENKVLQKYISKRIRLLRLNKGLTQEQLEEKADLGTNYVYKLENQSTNVKVKTLEKVMRALEVDFEEFFDISLVEKNEDLSELLVQIKELSSGQQDRVIKALSTLVGEIKGEK
ncbi:DNA-binding protein [Streptococcus porcinus]|uniref:Helix-turn-helix transcriptional regulator n=1 Tax=Streptococcus porcinus TaxID=1340 RepID=A0A4U9XUI0_STRPO|nr:helix-turn-helix transcriptional regulator [Streptococcus porcinus]MBA2795629.1 helix-turn-helix transcriptional regulator [Streptococcus porcinus]VTS16331.1 DNA-binding protein [Streptococcus porcinus]